MKTPIIIICLVLNLCMSKTLSSKADDQYTQSFTFYSENSYSGRNETFYVSELDVQQNTEVGKKAKSYCVNVGLWKVKGYLNGNPETTFDGWFNGVLGRLCITWHVGTQTATYLSVRRISGSNLISPSISVFTNTSFNGEEFHSEEEEIQFPSPVSMSSFAFTGRQNWGFYSGPNFNGDFECVPYFDFFGTHPLTFKSAYSMSVGSIRSGCEDTNTLHLVTQVKVVEVASDSSHANSASQKEFHVFKGSYLIGSISILGVNAATLIQPEIQLYDY